MTQRDNTRAFAFQSDIHVHKCRERKREREICNDDVTSPLKGKMITWTWIKILTKNPGFLENKNSLYKTGCKLPKLPAANSTHIIGD